MEVDHKTESKIEMELQRLISKYTEGDNFLSQPARKWIIDQVMQVKNGETPPDDETINNWIDKFCVEHGINFKHKRKKLPVKSMVIGTATISAIIGAMAAVYLFTPWFKNRPAFSESSEALAATLQGQGRTAAVVSQPCAGTRVLPERVLKLQLDDNCLTIKPEMWAGMETLFTAGLDYIAKKDIKGELGAEASIKAIKDIAPQSKVVQAAVKELTDRCRAVDACCAWDPSPKQRQVVANAYRQAQKAMAWEFLTDPYQGSAEQMRLKIKGADACAPELAQLEDQMARKYLHVAIRRCASRSQAAAKYCKNALSYNNSPEFLAEIHSLSCCASVNP